MRRISSRQTFFLKRIFPIIWFAALAAITYLAARDGAVPKVPLALIPMFMAVVGYVIMNQLVFDLADEVVDAGGSLSVRKGGRTVHIPLADIINVDRGYTRPPRVTLTLRTDTPFGRSIAFLPLQPFTLNPFASNAVVDELIERIDRARRSAGH